MSIPKIIHYCWFGRGEKSELINKCIESWHKFCPDYLFIEWNEDNFDVNFCPYAAKAYQEKRWGFYPMWLVYRSSIKTAEYILIPMWNYCVLLTIC